MFHLCGGHVFNSKRQDVFDWFWSNFNQEKDFVKTERNSVVHFNNEIDIPYPVENHLYMFEPEIQKNIISDLLNISTKNTFVSDNFGTFLRERFGETLYKIYFKPYNEKVWRCSLNDIPLSWLDGKLPMPTVKEILFNNINHVKEKSFVHSSFWYEKLNGSQYIADTLAKEIDICYSTPVHSLSYSTENKNWRINDCLFDIVVFCGNIKQLVHIVDGIDVGKYVKDVDALESHGTTTVFCEIDKNPYTWIYQPSQQHQSHRIICTGNFCETNNAASLPNDRITATVEFTDKVTLDKILEDLKQMPCHPKYICHQYNQYTYPIQNSKTRHLINNLKSEFMKKNLYITGRFAEWEYYNMDVAIGAAMDLCKSLNRMR